jgi:hypothetical protein
MYNVMKFLTDRGSRQQQGISRETSPVTPPHFHWPVQEIHRSDVNSSRPCSILMNDKKFRFSLFSLSLRKLKSLSEMFLHQLDGFCHDPPNVPHLEIVL